ncbi:toxin CptA [Orbus hercynius]|uniref:Toxin CptA n=1 Tax=Orbus hercynius TaxID=593135 RepID=A0A495RLQ2_9GAMM|nr:protein YgfX [Orbus hercynius]RKS87738.1 toxin CptA [Orbus hercynius]
MWRTQVVDSTKQWLLATLFYLTFITLIIVMLYETIFDSLIAISVILLVLEWWKACCYFKTIRGEIAIFFDSDELYWSRQRWQIIKHTLYFRYAIIIHLISKRNACRRVLFLMDDSFSRQDWRSLNYVLRHSFAKAHTMTDK